MIVCGWCGKPTEPTNRCTYCRHVDPARPWVQRGEEPEELAIAPGRPHLETTDVMHRLLAGRERLATEGRSPTVETLAEAMDVSPRTARRWLKVAGFGSVSALTPNRG